MAKLECENCGSEGDRLHTCYRCTSKVCSQCWDFSKGTCKNCRIVKKEVEEIPIEPEKEIIVDLDDHTEKHIRKKIKKQKKRQRDNLEELTRIRESHDRKVDRYRPSSSPISWGGIVSLIVGIVIFAVAVSVGSLVIDQVETSLIEEVEYNISQNDFPATQETLSGLEELIDWGSTIAVVIVAAVIVAILGIFFTVRP